MVRDLLEAALALQTRVGDWRLLARAVPEERQGAAGWTGALLCTRAVAGSQTPFSCTRVAQIPGQTLSLEVGAPPEYSLLPLAVLCGKAMLSWLCCRLGGSPASWRAALPCCREAKYTRLATNQGAVWASGCRMGERSCPGTGLGRG